MHFSLTVAGGDYESVNMTVTFEKDQLEAHILVKITDDTILEGKEVFTAVITPTLRDFPVFVVNHTTVIEIQDDDSECFT